MSRIAVMMFVLCGALLLCGFNASVRPVMVEGRRCVVLADAARANGWEMEPVSDGGSVIVSRDAFSIKMVRDSAAASIVNGPRLALLGKVHLLPGGEWVIGEEDLYKTLVPLLAEDKVPRTPVRRVVIDAGHGGHDPGAVRQGVQEKDLNLRLARRIAALLEKAGLTVILTRDGDYFVSLDKRADRVRLENGDIFISIHQNAAANEKASGTEVFFAPENRYVKASMHLANTVLLGVLLKTEGKFTAPLDRGVKRANFRVLRKADCPAILIECGFISNAQEREKLLQDDYLESFARAAATGIVVYCQLAEPPEKGSADEQVRDEEEK